MDFWGHKNTSFSPYHDEDRLIDFLDDDAQRYSINLALVFFVHIGLALALSANFVVPDLLPPPEPDSVTVQIVTFDPTQPEPEVEAEPEPVIVEPVLAPPPPAPQPKPQPKPAPEPVPPPPPPPPPPEPVPEPEPEVIFTPPPPPPEILSQPEPDIVEPELADPIIEPLPEPVPQVLPEQPVIEIFEPQPIQPDPLPEPIIIEPLPEPLPDPLPELPPEPLPEPEFEIEIFEPVPEIVVEPEIIEPEIEAPVILDETPPTPGVIDAEPLPELIEPEPLPPEIIIEPEPIPEPVQPDPVPEPEPVEPEPREPEILPTAPTILASPDAPETQEEERRAVPQEQSDPFIDLLKRDRDQGQQNPPRRSLTGPSRGGGNEGPVGGINQPPGGGTAIGRSNPGGGNWTLAPQSEGTGNEAYKGITLDIRCREAGRTHLDCPEYLRKNRGRAADGSESGVGLAGRGTDRGVRIENPRTIPTRGDLVPQIGDNSINAGGPSTGPLDSQDQNFDREFLGKKLYQFEPEPGDLDWLLKPSDPVNTPPNSNLEPLPQDDGDADTDWLLKKPRE